MYDHQCARAGAHECVEVIINSAVDSGAGGAGVGVAATAASGSGTV